MNHYSYRVIWSQDDGEYVGLCAEFPSLSWLAENPGKALDGIMEVVTDVVADMTANGETLPQAIGEKSYSGQFKVRVPPSLHRNLVLEAAEAGVSMNRLVSAKLAA